jgi:hypothetical protein
MTTAITTDMAEHMIATLRAHEGELRRAGIRHLSLFGSVARGDATVDSDVDLAVEFAPPRPHGPVPTDSAGASDHGNPRPTRGLVARTCREATPAGQHRSGPPSCLLGTIPLTAWPTLSRTSSGSKAIWLVWTNERSNRTDTRRRRALPGAGLRGRAPSGKARGAAKAWSALG